MRLTNLLRIMLRTSAFVITTAGVWFCFESEALLRGKSRRSEMINQWVPRWARLNLWIYKVQIAAHGPYVEDGNLYPSCAGDGEAGRVFVMNHRSSLDIPIVLSVAEAHAISRHDLASWPLLGWSAKRVGTLFVDRDSRRSGASVLRAVDSALKAGEGVVMFPEGTSFPGDEVREFRPGAFNAARRAGAEIVPMGIAYGDGAAYYHHETFADHAKRVACLSKLPVAIEVGDPLDTTDLTPVEVIELARTKVQQLVDSARARLEAQNEGR